MNKLIPILLIGVVVIVCGIAWFSISMGESETAPVVAGNPALAPPLPQGRVSDPDAADLQAAASYAAQLKGTTGQVQSLERQIKTFVSDTDKKIAEETEKALQRQLPLLEQKLREQIRQEEQAKLQAQQPQATPQPQGSNRVVDTARATSDETILQPPTGRTSRLLNPALSNVPAGFGFDNLDSSVNPVKLPFDALSTAGRSGSTTRFGAGEGISNHPGYTKIAAWQPNLPLPVAPHASSVAPGSVVDTQTAGGADKNKQAKSEKPQPIPVYTIENTATLFSNTTMTALMGVVPNKNNAVKNLMRFKVITGSENIASNGLLLPDVKNIIWTGYAIGNREMECVQATVDTITFTFQDGTIRTVKKKQSGSSGQLSEGLGYLSDRWGKPCIKGTLISNAAQYLRDRMIAAGAAATASASAAMQTTTSRDALGGSSTTVTGSEGEFIAGQTGTATLNELAAYLRDRMDQAVDIVYLDAGKDVVIHVEEQVDIDYDPAGRKLSHIALSQQTARARKARLD